MTFRTKAKIMDFIVWMIFANGTWIGCEYLIESKHWAIGAVATLWYFYALVVDGIVFKDLHKYAKELDK